MRPQTPLVVLNYLLRGVLACVFVIAAVGKLRAGMNPDAPRTLYDLWISAGSVWHYLFVGGEFLLGAWLLSGLLPRASAVTSLAVLAVFSGLIAYETTKHAPRDCGCLGGGRVVEVTPHDVRKGLYRSLATNGVFMLSSLWLAIMSGPPPKPRESTVTNAAPEANISRESTV